MEKVETALALFNTVLATHGEKLREKLSKKSAQNIAQQEEAEKAFSELEETCAHLRAEISSLKKQCATQIQDSQKAGKQIDAAIQQLDTVLSVNESVENELHREGEYKREGEYNG